MATSFVDVRVDVVDVAEHRLAAGEQLPSRTGPAARRSRHRPANRPAGSAGQASSWWAKIRLCWFWRLLAPAGDVGVVQRVAAEDVVHRPAPRRRGTAPSRGQVERGRQHHRVVEDVAVAAPEVVARVARHRQPVRLAVERRRGSSSAAVDHGGGSRCRSAAGVALGTVARSSRPSAAVLPQPKPAGGEDVAGVVRRGRHVGQERGVAGGQVQLGGGPVELVGDVVVAVGAAAGAVVRVGVPACRVGLGRRRTRCAPRSGSWPRTPRRTGRTAGRTAPRWPPGSAWPRSTAGAARAAAGRPRAASGGRSSSGRASCGAPSRRAACRPAPACASGTPAPSGPRRGCRAPCCPRSGTRSVLSPSAAPCRGGDRRLGALEACSAAGRWRYRR